MNRPEGNYEISSLKRGLLILNCFLASPDSTFSISEVARAIGIHRATTLKFLYTLEASGYIEGEKPGRYRLCSRKWREVALREQVQPPWPLMPPLAAVPILKQLVDETGETADMDVLYQGQVVLVHVVEGLQSVRVRKQVGAMRPAHMTAGGKVLLANLSESALEYWLEGRTLETNTANSIGSTARLKAELAEIRRSGYAVDEQEFELGLTCLAAPVRDALGNVFAAVAISGPSSRVSYHRMPELALAVKRAAERLAHPLGAQLQPVRPEELEETEGEATSNPMLRSNSSGLIEG